MDSEEDLKFRLIGPWLKALGLSRETIRMETSFTLILGTHAYEKKRGAEKKGAAGRSDFLVSNADGKPLLIVEAKRPGEEITDEDVSQGVSYARLLPTIAPFVLVTNGTTSKLVDSVTQKELADVETASRMAQWRRGEFLVGTDDLALRAEALSLFLGYSADNLKEFARTQVAARAAGLLHNGHSARVIQEVYVPRQRLQEAFGRFMSADSSTFVVDGASGMGKTNALYNLAHDALQEHFVLFFRAADLAGPVQACIAAEFGWTFSDQIPLVEIVKRIASFAKRSGQKAILVFDGIDEYLQPDAVEQFNELVGRLHEFRSDIRLLVSLKTVSLARFWFHRGIPSPLNRHAWTQSPVNGEGDRTARASFTLENFAKTEIDLAIQKYRQHFGFQGDVSRALREHLSDPFLLRVVAELCRGKQLFNDLYQPDLIRRYIDLRLDTLREDGERKAARAALIAAAEATLPSELRQAIVAEPDNGAACAAECGLLALLRDERGRDTVRFSFDRVKDYVVVFWVLRLDQRRESELEPLGEKLCSAIAGRSALELYWNSVSRGSTRPQATLRNAVRTAATAMIRTYNMLRAQLASSVQERMLPRRPRGVVALVYAIEGPGDWAWGFAAPSAQGDPSEVAEKPHLWRPFEDDASAPDSPIGLTWQSVWPLVEAPDLFAAEHFLKRLREVVRKGGLDEGSQILLRETIRAAVGRNTQQLGVGTPPRWNHYVRDLGLDIGEINIESTRRAIHATWAEREARYQGSYPPMDPRTQEAVVAARRRALAGERFKKPNVIPRNAYGRLDEALQALQEIGETFVSSDLPAPDVSLATPTESLAEAYSTNSLADLIVAVRSRFASEWPTFIALNFGQLGRLESFLKAAPAAEAIQYEPQRNQFIGSFTARYALIPGRYRILVGIADISPVIVHDQDQHWPFVRADGTLIRADSWGHCDLETLLGWDGYLPLGWEGPQGYFTPVRGLLYQRVRAALEKIDAAALVRLLQEAAK